MKELSKKEKNQILKKELKKCKKEVKFYEKESGKDSFYYNYYKERKEQIEKEMRYN